MLTHAVAHYATKSGMIACNRFFLQMCGLSLARINRIFAEKRVGMGHDMLCFLLFGGFFDFEF